MKIYLLVAIMLYEIRKITLFFLTFTKVFNFDEYLLHYHIF